MTSEAEAYARDLDSGRIGADFVWRRLQALRTELSRAVEHGAGSKKIAALRECVADLEKLARRGSSGRLRRAR